jgi:hypothetical protein
MSKNNNSNEDMNMEILNETDNFAVWRSKEEEGQLYHIELGSITLHLDDEEWLELVELIQGAMLN